MAPSDPVELDEHLLRLVVELPWFLDAVVHDDIPAGNVAEMERAMIEKALQDARFNKSHAAKLLGLTRAQLYIRLRRYGL